MNFANKLDDITAKYNGCIKACCVFMYLQNTTTKKCSKRKAGKFTTQWNIREAYMISVANENKQCRIYNFVHFSHLHVYYESWFLSALYTCHFGILYAIWISVLLHVVDILYRLSTRLEMYFICEFPLHHIYTWFVNIDFGKTFFFHRCCCEIFNLTFCWFVKY